jgi:glycerol kinase
VSSVLAVDQGTTGTRAVVFGDQGQQVASAYRELTQYYPEEGWVEHDPVEIWQSVQAVVEEAVEQAGSAPVAVGLANQRETTVLWDRRTGQPLHRAIVWQCRRTADLCAELKAQGLEPLVRERTGLVLDPYFSGTKLRWLLDHVPGAREQAERGEALFGTVDTWLLYHLTGGRAHVTDRTNASRTLLYDLRRRDWDLELLDALSIPRACLPEIRDSVALYGEIEAGPLAGRPVLGVAGDQQAALFGQGCVRPGERKNTYGTGCFLLLNTGETPVRSEQGLLTTAACGENGRPCYALEGSVFVGGAVVQWLRDELGLIATAEESEAVAASVPDTGGVIMVPAFVGLGAPHWDPNARGAILGLTRGTGRAQLVRAGLEAIAFQSGEVVQAMEAEAGERTSVLRVDGGACRNDLLMQMQADLSACPVERPRETETTALGAAFLAGLGAGVWRNTDELRRLNPTERRFDPTMADEQRKRKWAAWRAAVRRVLSAV